MTQRDDGQGADLDVGIQEIIMSVRDIQEELALSPEQLDEYYNPEGDGEHPIFTRLAWRLDVVREDTLSSYWAWVANQIDGAYQDLMTGAMRRG